MTWVFASPVIFGYAVGVSDIRVTFDGGKSKDCLQKIYAVGPYIAAGFAGSVYLGFKMVDSLRVNLRGIPPDHAWYPDWVAETWRPYAQKIFREADKQQQELGSAVILLGVDPNETLGGAPFSKTMVIIMRAPGFEPKFVPIGRWDGIGSGMTVEAYQELLTELNDPSRYHPLMQMEVGNPGGFGFVTAGVASQTIRKHPSVGVSNYVHYCKVRLGEIMISELNVEEFTNQGNRSYTMPPVAKSWNELQELLRSEASDIMSATAGQLMIIGSR